MTNPRLTGSDNEPWFTFDVLVSSNVSTTYLDNSLMKIAYDDRVLNSSFGSNIVANNNAEVLLIGAFNSSTYADPSTLISDDGSGTSHILNIPTTIEFTTVPLNRVLITTTPQSMLTVRIKVKNSGKTMDILYTDKVTSSGLSYFTVAASTPWTGSISSYSTTDYTGSNSDESAIPIITNFNNNVPAGKGEILTISGKYFGQGMGPDGSVIFKNADTDQYPTRRSVLYNRGIDPYDVVSWNDNEIKVKIPAVIDSINDVAGQADFQAVAGTGYFKVRNRYGYEKESSTELDIPHAIMQDVERDLFTAIHKYNPELTGSENGGYIVRISQDVIYYLPKS